MHGLEPQTFLRPFADQKACYTLADQKTIFINGEN